MLPSNHKKVDTNNIGDCPYMKAQAKKDKNNKPKKMKSGCPVMISDKKKNPALEKLQESYDVPLISQFNYLLEHTSFFLSNQDVHLISKEQLKEIYKKQDRDIFEQHPQYLKHTLLWAKDEQFMKIRKMEVSSKYFVFEELKEKGNKQYTLKNYNEAIQFYERAYSIYRYLIEIEDNQDKDSFKQIFNCYTDKNTKLIEKEGVVEQTEKDMYDSSLYQIQINIATAYMALNHYTQARVAIENAQQINDKQSLSYFRLAQCIVYNQFSTLEELYEAKEIFIKAEKLKQIDKIFQNKEGILKLLNVLNHVEAFKELGEYIEKRIQIKEIKETKKLQKMFKEVIRIEKVREDIIKRGLDPIDNSQDIVEEFYNTEQYAANELEIVYEMLHKYNNVIKFNQEQKDTSQLEIARKEQQQFCKTYCKIQFWKTLKVQQHKLFKKAVEGFDINFDSFRIQTRMKKLIIDQIQKNFNNGDLNLQMMEYAMSEIYKRKEVFRDLKQKQEKQDQTQKITDKLKQLNWIVVVILIISLITFKILI